MTADKSLLVTFEADKTDPDEPVVTTENTMILSNVTANIGTTVTFPIGLNNVDEITALQMDLHLPKGITLATDEYGDVKIETTNRVSNNHTVDCNKIADGNYRIICYSTKNNTFTGNSGELFSLSLVVGSELMDGDYEITATNIEMSDKTGTAYSGQDVKGVVTVKSYMPGDVDGNGQHSINDVVCIINYVLNAPTRPSLKLRQIWMAMARFLLTMRVAHIEVHPRNDIKCAYGYTCCSSQQWRELYEH